jgi:TonB family protein
MQTIDSEITKGVMNDVMDPDFKRGFKISLALHAALLIFAVFKGLIFPSAPTPSIPVLRVDVVGLPDLLKSEMREVPPALPQTEVTTPDLKPLERAPEPDEMTLSKTKKLEDKSDRSRDLRKKNAISRLRALEKIINEENKKPGVLVKGSQISPGTSLSEDAREAAEASYLDIVRDSVRSQWVLPMLLARQSLSARMLIFINARGQVIGMKWISPSGDARFDDAVKNAIQASNPLPAPPKDLASGFARSGIVLAFPM